MTYILYDFYYAILDTDYFIFLYESVEFYDIFVSFLLVFVYSYHFIEINYVIFDSYSFIVHLHVHLGYSILV